MRLCCLFFACIKSHAVKANRNHKKLTAYSVYTSGLSVLCTEIARQGCLRAHMAVFAMLLHSRIAPVNTIFARLYFAGIFEVRLYRFSSRSASINSVFCADFSSFFFLSYILILIKCYFNIFCHRSSYSEKSPVSAFLFRVRYIGYITLHHYSRCPILIFFVFK